MSMKYLVILGWMGLSAEARADVAEADFQGCKQIESPEARLACFDALESMPDPPPEPGEQTEIAVQGQRFTLAYAPSGRFVMGSPESEKFRDSDEEQHTVTLSRGFHVSTTPVTQELYKAVMKRNPSQHYACDSCPVENLDWFKAVKFCNRLSELEDLVPAYIIRRGKVTLSPDADGYRLLSEAEWEYAARAGKRQVYAGSNHANSVAWYDENSGYNTQPVATKKANEWGLHDMSGNVWEWTGDWYDQELEAGVIDPLGASKGDMRVFRGGCVEFSAGGARVANRSMHNPRFKHEALGFRIARNE
jgi:formylglycine-generating enzyme required for sulfatase activity